MGKKLLLVDDEQVVRDLIKVALSRETSIEIHEAKNAAEGMAKAKELMPDLVILDLMMPDKWGYTVCDELKNDPRTSGIRVMFLTGRGSAPSQKMGQLKGGDDYMVKPFDPAQLKAKVKKLLDLD